MCMVTNICKCSLEEAFNIIKNWLDKCSKLRSLDFNPNYAIKYYINSARTDKSRKAEDRKRYLYNVLAR